MRTLLLASVATLTALSASPAFASDEAETLADAITKGKTTINFRLRNENVSQDGFADNANALTLRTRLKYSTGVFKGFSAVVEVDNVLALDNNYNSTINGRINRPVVADPKTTEINQAYVAYTGINKTTLIAGRMALNMDNQRFVGTVGWRQNDQTYDLLAGIVKPNDDLTLTGGYVWNVNRIFSDRHTFGNLDTDSFVVNGKYTGLGFGNLTAYGLFIDLNDAPVLALSSQTLGVRFDGKQKIGDGNLTALYEAEFATQSDYKDSPLNYNAQYYHLSAGLSAHGFTGKIGYEVLGSDNGVTSFQTPLATLHKFNGWADKFLATPAGGLEDFYGSLFYKVGGDSPLKGLTFGAVYHDFSADVGGDYGNEINLLVKKKLSKGFYTSIKYADYNSNGFATDTRKLWFTLGANY
ncbi:MAG: alginate export family protein [Robiginitomaculum sp.]|nr:alginate export family protein [Robiginitomaculum sp.]